MSQEQKTEDERTRARAKREVPKGANINPSRSGWIVLALVAGAFIAMRFMGDAGGEKIKDLS